MVRIWVSSHRLLTSFIFENLVPKGISTFQSVKRCLKIYKNRNDPGNEVDF